MIKRAFGEIIEKFGGRSLVSANMKPKARERDAHNTEGGSFALVYKGGFLFYSVVFLFYFV